MKKSNESWWTYVNQGSKTSPKWEVICVILLSVLLVQKKEKIHILWGHFIKHYYNFCEQQLSEKPFSLPVTPIWETVFPDL